MVTNIQKLDATQQGKPKQKFEIVDGEGTAIPVIGIGRNASGIAITEGMAVVIFNATVRGGLGGSEGGMYLFKDAMIVAVSANKSPVTVRERISVGDANA